MIIIKGKTQGEIVTPVSKGCIAPKTHTSEGAFAKVQGCTAPPYFEMDCNATPNFGDLINNLLQMGLQNQIPN